MSVLLIKQRISISVPPFGQPRGDVWESSLAGRKAHSRLSIIEHFTLALTAEALIRRNWPMLKGVGHFGAKY